MSVKDVRSTNKWPLNLDFQRWTKAKLQDVLQTAVETVFPINGEFHIDLTGFLIQ